MKALLGLHDELFGRMTVRTLNRFGYETKLVMTLDEMVKEIESSNGIPSHDLYFMDVNLGKYGVECCEASKKVHEMLNGYIASGEAKFVAVSGGLAYNLAQKEGIPSLMKGSQEFNDYMRSLRVR